MTLREKPRLIIISPHFDDAALCLGGLLARLSSQGSSRSAFVINVFTRSCYVRPGFIVDPADIDTISNLRAVEDAEFCAGLGISSVNLGLPDSSAIGLSDYEETRQSVDRDTRMAELMQLLLPHLGENDLIACPMGIGNHIDHLVVRECVKRLVKCADNVVFFEDLPYSIELPGKFAEAEATLSSFGWRSVPLPILVPLSLKARALEIYRSQLDKTTIDSVLRHSKSASVERALEHVMVSRSRLSVFSDLITT